ncbi:putative isoflavone oxidoreductase [Tricladium varicosporioides]|nr:putative isoflavone oxidoreductase [Hymenoscyphus varicosporioides]
MPTPNILVLGAGELGTAILHSLSTTLPPTTKLTCAVRSSMPSLPSRVTVIHADIAALGPQELIQLFKPFTQVISALGFAAGPGTQVKITNAVLAAGIKQYIPWQFGVDYDIIGRGSAQPVWDEQLDIRDSLRRQKGTEWMIISTGMFTSFLFEVWFGVIVGLKDPGKKSEVKVRALGGWENSVTVTTPRDIGRVVAAIVAAKDLSWNRVVYTAGETITYEKLAKLVEGFIGEGGKVERKDWNAETLRKELKADPDNVIKRYRVVFAEGKGVSWNEKETFNVKSGIELQDVRGWMKENLK